MIIDILFHYKTKNFGFFLASFAEDSDEVLYATNHEILLYQVTLQKSITLAENLRDVVEIDFDYETQTLFYVSEFRKIHSMNIITKDEKVFLLTLIKKYLKNKLHLCSASFS